jgi:hypothetical protein
MRGQRVCMFGSALGEALFPAGDGIGRTIFLNGGEFTVVGIFAPAKRRLLWREWDSTARLSSRSKPRASAIRNPPIFS